MAYDVTIERTTDCPTAVVKADTTQREFPALWGAMLDDVWAFLGATPGLRTDGHNVMLYRSDVPEAEVAVEVGVQVTGSFEAAGRVVPSALPAAEAATTVHTGTPAEIGAAHSAVRAWCYAQHRALTGVSWEIYGDPDPQTGHFDVTVYWQLAED
jgi:effector-binding domain-containing protein